MVTKPTASIPGSVVAIDSMPIPDELNDYWFRVRVVTTRQTDEDRRYDLEVKYALQDEVMSVQFPPGRDKLTPILSRGEEPLVYIVGFRLGDDDKIYDYYMLDGSKRGRLSGRYIKAYTLP
jgi:hypothetical protein